MSTKAICLAASLVLASFGSHAQTAPAAQDATTQTREMAARLHLNEGQFVKLLSVNRTRLARQQQIENTTKGNPAARTTQLAELQSQYEQECSRILSPSQLSHLQPDGASQPAATTANGNG